MSHTVDRDYVCRVQRPQDFDAFWDGLLAEVAQAPLNAEMQADPLRSTSETEVFQVHYDSLDGVRIFGWYSRPRAAAGTLPALVEVPGYISDPPLSKAWAGRGYAIFNVAPRGKIRSNSQINPGYPGLLSANLTDRNSYHYRGFYIDAVRALDFLLERPEVDPTRIGVMGSSQGGALAIVVAALRSEVAAVSIGAPYLCGFMDCVELTTAYPYHEIRDYLRLHPERQQAVEDTLAYFDGINFAPRIACPVIVNLGLQDNVVPPESGFHLFREIGSADKRLYEYDGCGHDAGRSVHNAIMREFLDKHLRP